MMKNMIYILLTTLFSVEASGQEAAMTAEALVSAMDKNLNAKTRVLTSKMIVHGRRTSRTIKSRNWVKGINQAYTEYLAPPREAGTKMLKSGDKLWTYSPQTDRVIQISGHMLRQSVMGSDMSYNDMMEDRPLTDLYEAIVEGSEMIDGRKHWILFLEARVKGLSYPKRRAWVDSEYLLPMKEELYAKSGKLLKSTSMDGIKKVQDRWFPTRFIFKDELKKNSKGTEWIIDDIAFDTDIPDFRFEKAMLRK